MGAVAAVAPHVLVLFVRSGSRAIRPHRLSLANLAGEEDEE